MNVFAAIGKGRAKVGGLLCVAVASAFLAAPDVSPAAKVCSYRDPDFASHRHPFDIEDVTVRRAEDGRVVFAMTFVDPPPLSRDTGFQVSIDADGRGDTGDADGYEFYFDYVAARRGRNPALHAWRRAKWEAIDSRSLKFSPSRARVTFSIDARELGDPPAFDFSLLAGTSWSTDDADLDYAPQREHATVSPDEPGKWSYPSCPQPRKLVFGLTADDIVGLLFGLWLVAGLLTGLGALAYFSYRRLRRRSSSLSSVR
jgi:hypothetical protein